MNDLRIHFTRQGDSLSFRLAPSWEQHTGDPTPFAPCLSAEDEEELRWYLEDYLDLPQAGALIRAARVERRLAEWGKRLFTSVFGDRPHPLIEAMLERGAPQSLTVCSEALDVLRLPWELLADDRGPLTRQGIVVRRMLDARRAPPCPPVAGAHLRILLVVSRPVDTAFIDPRHTARAMLATLAEMEESAEIDVCRPATLRRLGAKLAAAERSGGRYTIVHFHGHGTFSSELQASALCFERDDASTDLVSGRRLGALLVRHHVPLVVLEACRGAQLGNLDALRGLAPTLVASGAGSVIAMTHAVHVDATRALFQALYRGLLAGATVGEALDAGRAALMADPFRRIERAPGGKYITLHDWFVATLYQGGSDVALLPKGGAPLPRRGAKRRRAMAGGNSLGAFPPAPQHGFTGRARELHDLDRGLQIHRSILVHAMGGMGKTSLAREVAAWCCETGLFPDGACFVSFEQAGAAARIVSTLGGHLMGSAFAKLSADAQIEAARSLFQRRRILMVWDNVDSLGPDGYHDGRPPLYTDEERAQIQAIVAAWTGEPRGHGRLLLTSRSPEVWFPVHSRMELRGLSRSDSQTLLHRAAEGRAAESEQERLGSLLDALEDHPLSIELVAPWLRTMTPAEITGDLQAIIERSAGDPGAERNRSLLASLEFSTRRLRPEVRASLGWLRLFRGGVFEENLLDLSRMDADVWRSVRAELEGAALLRVEQGAAINNRPYLRFHPTLSHATMSGVVDDETKHRYIQTYLSSSIGIHRALDGSAPHAGLVAMGWEEANFWTAVAWALDLGAHDEATHMSDTLRVYFERSGRLAEWSRWSTWLAGKIAEGGFSEASAHHEVEAALLLVQEGKAEDAAEKLEALIAKLAATTTFDAGFLSAFAQRQLGRVLDLLGRSRAAVEVLRAAVLSWEALLRAPQATGDPRKREARLTNLSGTLGDLANALRGIGHLDEALSASERSCEMTRALGHQRDLAVGLSQSAHILLMQRRLSEADRRYEESLETARRAGDMELEGTVVQHQGKLAMDLGQHERASALYRRSLQIFEEMGDAEGVMQTCTLLGVLDQKSGRRAEARAWHTRAWEIADGRNHLQGRSAAAQNLGITFQEEGMIALERGDDPFARTCLTEAARFVEASLAGRRALESEPAIAVASNQLGQIRLLLGDLGAAEAHVEAARRIRERLGLKDVYMDYNTLADIARARGDAGAAAAWESKRDAVIDDLQRRTGAPALRVNLRAVETLATLCARAGLEGRALEPSVEASLVHLASAPAPFDRLAAMFRALAVGEIPELAPGLPDDVADIVGAILTAVQQATTRPPIP